MKDRVVADRLWRSADARRHFEVETGLTDATSEGYQSKFTIWALRWVAAYRKGERWSLDYPASLFALVN